MINEIKCFVINTLTEAQIVGIDADIHRLPHPEFPLPRRYQAQAERMQTDFVEICSNCKVFVWIRPFGREWVVRIVAAAGGSGA